MITIGTKTWSSKLFDLWFCWTIIYNWWQFNRV